MAMQQAAWQPLKEETKPSIVQRGANRCSLLPMNRPPGPVKPNQRQLQLCTRRGQSCEMGGSFPHSMFSFQGFLSTVSSLLLYIDKQASQRMWFILGTAVHKVSLAWWTGLNTAKPMSLWWLLQFCQRQYKTQRHCHWIHRVKWPRI